MAGPLKYKPAENRRVFHIMSGMPPPGIPTGSFSGISATTHSVVRMFLVIEGGVLQRPLGASAARMVVDCLRHLRRLGGGESGSRLRASEWARASRSCWRPDRRSDRMRSSRAVPGGG